VDHVEHFKLWQETRRFVAELQRAVERGERVNEAIQFSRYLMWSGVLRELKAFPRHDQPAGLQTDAGLLEWEVSELLQAALRVPECKRLGSFEERVLKNLDVIAGHVQRLAPPSSANATASTGGGAP